MFAYAQIPNHARPSAFRIFQISLTNNDFLCQFVYHMSVFKTVVKTMLDLVILQELKHTFLAHIEINEIITTDSISDWCKWGDLNDLNPPMGFHSNPDWDTDYLFQVCLKVRI